MKTFEEVKSTLEFYFGEDKKSVLWIEGYIAGLYETCNINEGVYTQLTDWLKTI